jgi:primosomal protein N'
VAEREVNLGLECPSCAEPWLRATNLPGRYRCVYCMHRFEIRSECPHCGMHSTIARMSDTAILTCNSCGASMLRAI